MKKDLLNLIADGKLRAALNAMREIEDTQNEYFRDPLIGLMSRFNRNENAKNDRVISDENYNMEQNRIIAAIKSVLESEFDESKVPASFKIPKAEPVPPATPPPSPSAKPAIYFSYAWGVNTETGESREQIMQDLYESLKADGFNVKRDKENVGYKDSIGDFMHEIGQGGFIVVAITDKYLKSEFCMYEMYEIFRNSKLEKQGFVDRIFPIKVESIKLSDPDVMMIYFDHWEQTEKKWENLIVKFGTRISTEQQEQYRRVKAIANDLGDFMAFLGDMNTSTKDLLSKDNFREIKEAISTKMVKS